MLYISHISPNCATDLIFWSQHDVIGCTSNASFFSFITSVGLDKAWMGTWDVRRAKVRLPMFYQILNNLIAIKSTQFFLSKPMPPEKNMPWPSSNSMQDHHTTTTVASPGLSLFGMSCLTDRSTISRSIQGAACQTNNSNPLYITSNPNVSYCF